MIQINVLSAEPVVEITIPEQIIVAGEYPHYTGSYEIHSTATTQTLGTEDKVLDDNIVILPNVIHQIETPNTSGWSLTIR